MLFMQVTIISGSQRKDSNSWKTAELIAQQVAQQQRFKASHLIDLSRAPLPLFNPAEPRAGRWEELSRTLQQSSALIVVCPEWHGMAPSALKNFFLYCTQLEVSHKPALLVSVSSGIGGAYPVAELRISSYKNNRLLWLPENLILRNIAGFLQSYPDTNDENFKNLPARLAYALALVHEYAGALSQVRASEVFNPALFANGM
jgi:hypothetical protein